LFQRRSFLAYHGKNFLENHRFVGFYKGPKLLAVINFSLSVCDHKRIVMSPHGASYGGFVLCKSIGFSESMAIIDAFSDYCKEENVNEVNLAFAPDSCAKHSIDVLFYALQQSGYILVRRDIESIFVKGLSNFSSRSIRSAKKALKNNISLTLDGNIDDFWLVMSKTFRKHGVNPTHTKDELIFLADNNPTRFKFPIAYHQDVPIAALGCFLYSDHFDSTFYILHDPDFQHFQALTHLMHYYLNNLPESIQAVSFGTCNNGLDPRHHIFEFKENFSKIFEYRDHYQRVFK
jgi:hypothetical protein